MELMQIIPKLEKSNIYGLMGNIDINTNNNNYFIIDDYKFKETAQEYLNNPKAIAALKMVLLNEDCLTKKVNELSLSEIKRIILAKALLSNKEYLIFNYFDKDLTNKEKEEFKRLFKRLATDYNKTILIFTNDITFIWEIASSLIYVEENSINIYNKNDFNILNYITKPNIIEFIDLMHAKGLDIAYYKNPADLLKAIYRLKEKK